MADYSAEDSIYFYVINFVVGVFVPCIALSLYWSLYSLFEAKKLRHGDNIKNVQGLIIHKISINGYYHIKYIFNIQPEQTYQQIYSRNMALMKGFINNETVLIPSAIIELIEKFYGRTQFNQESVINAFDTYSRQVPATLFDVGGEIELLFDPNRPYCSSLPKVTIQSQEYQNELKLRIKCLIGTILCIVITWPIILCACHLWCSLSIFVASICEAVLIIFIEFMSMSMCHGPGILNGYHNHSKLIKEAEEKANEQDTSLNESV